MTDPTMGGMVDPTGGGGAGWHGAGAGSGWFGNRQYEINPRTGMPKGGGWSKNLTPKQRVKRWARSNAKAQWRYAKKDVRRVKRDTIKKWNKSQKARDKNFAVQNDRTQARDPETRKFVSNRKPPDGAIANCRNCGYQVQYSSDRSRWEHTGKGKASCFGK